MVDFQKLTNILLYGNLKIFINYKEYYHKLESVKFILFIDSFKFKSKSTQSEKSY